MPKLIFPAISESTPDIAVAMKKTRMKGCFTFIGIFSPMGEPVSPHRYLKCKGGGLAHLECRAGCLGFGP
jgi:hypothetical protein